MEVPPYRWPSLKGTLLMLWDRSKIFLKQAGSIILLVNILLWFLASFPKSNGPEPVRDSYAGQIGVLIEPLIKPLGYNWKIGVGLIGSQAAREVIVSSLSTIYALRGTRTPRAFKRRSAKTSRHWRPCRFWFFSPWPCSAWPPPPW
jgi:ferrous iron transport protein B